MNSASKVAALFVVAVVVLFLASKVHVSIQNATKARAAAVDSILAQ